MRKYIAVVALLAIVAIVFFLMAGKRSALQSNAIPPPIAAMAKDVVATGGQAERVTMARTPASAHSAWAPQIARAGKLSLFVNDPKSAANAVMVVARRYDGQVLSLVLATGGGGEPASATMQIRVPADRYESAVNAVAAVGRVRERSESAQDLTGDISDSTARLENLQRTETDMRKIMDRSGTVEQILDVENQLSQVREQIQTLESETKTMRSQVTYSTIDVSLTTEAGALPVDAAPASQLASAWQSAIRALIQTTVAFASAVVWMVVFAPYALIVAGIGALLLRRRARA